MHNLTAGNEKSKTSVSSSFFRLKFRFSEQFNVNSAFVGQHRMHLPNIRSFTSFVLNIQSIIYSMASKQQKTWQGILLMCFFHTALSATEL